MDLKKVVLILSGLSLVAHIGFSQIVIPEEEEETERIGSGILDDSTKQIYGPTTTRFTLEENIKYNNPHYWNIDTTVLNLHRYQYVARERNLYQDLGNIGTAISPIYPKLPHRIGATSGFTVYDMYYEGPEAVRYYDTKSPYSMFGVIWGGEGRAITDAKYSRNIDERSNIGIDFKGLFIDKQIQRVRRGDRHVEGIYYRGYGSYSTKNGKYTALANFIRNRHQVDEYGGILLESDTLPRSAYFDENRQTILTEAGTDELRTNYHLYHQYKLNDFIQLYHSFDRYKQQNDFLDTPDTTSAFYDFYEVDSTDTKDRSKLTYIQNEVGVKGDIGKTFYNFYYKARKVDFEYKYIEEDTLGFDTDYLENYAGFNLRFGNDSVSYISAYGEYMLGGEYKLGGEIRAPWFYAEAISVKYTPAYIQNAYRGSHDVWKNDFDSPISSSLRAGLNLKLGPVRLMPSAEYTLLTNYIYFRDNNATEGQRVLPVQTSGDINLLKGQLDLSVDFLKVFNFNTKLIYSNVSGGSADAISVPELFGNAQVYYHEILLDGNLEWQIGFDLHMRSAYYAQAYDPIIMQYYIQDEFKVEPYPVWDVFLNAKINRGRFFLKYNNIVRAFRPTGYFMTPYYPAQDDIFDFGFSWSFYD
ncbi:putative porin [Fulvivirga ulvae]|uniref:putative porin n=1 Tax=Fulvivirga ulvae TaxID=2904245 RepID=UPI001F3E0F09|nr:putative porin [Fulvivirga ulvae]UII30527.1 putative porin [Fulvivirga ulvae]